MPYLSTLVTIVGVIFVFILVTAIAIAVKHELRDEKEEVQEEALTLPEEISLEPLAFIDNVKEKEAILYKRLAGVSAPAVKEWMLAEKK